MYMLAGQQQDVLHYGNYSTVLVRTHAIIIVSVFQ